MKVLHVNCNYTTTALHQTMIETLERRAIENMVFAPTHNKENTVIIPNENVVVSECFEKLDRVNFYRKQHKIIEALEHNIDVNSFDIIHAYTLFTDGNCAMEVASKYKLPYVVAIRDTDVNCFFKYMPHLRKKGLEIMLNASAVFFLSPSYRNEVLQKYVPEKYRGELEKKIHVIPNGIDSFWYEKTSLRNYGDILERLKNNTIKVVYVGRISKRKNITTTQKALELLRKMGWETEFTVIGGIDDEKEYSKIIEDKHTKYFAKKPMREIKEIYKEQDVFIMPSHTETFGLVYAEAMSQGLPVIYTKNQGFDGQFKDGYVGFAVDDNDAKTIMDAIIRIVSKYEEISKNAVTGADKFKWEDICNRYIMIYKKLYKE